MEIHIGSVKSFREQFESAARLCNPKSPRPILGSVLLTADGDAADGRVELAATDLESWSIVRALGVEIVEPGRVLLPSERVRAILAKIDAGGGVTIRSSVAGMTEIASGRSKAVLQTEPADEFPEIDIPALVNGLRLTAADLKRLIGQTIFIPDEESSNSYTLGGCLFDRELLSLSVVATDGRRVACSGAILDPFGDPMAVRPIVPSKILRHIKAALAAIGDDNLVAIGFDENHAVFDVGPIRLMGRLMEGRFPEYRRAWPAKAVGVAAAHVGPLRSAVELASAVSGQGSRGIRFSFRESDSLWLNATTVDVGTSDVQVDVDYTGPEIEVILDGPMMIQGLGVLKADDRVVVEVVDGIAPVVLRCDSYEYLLCPMTKS